MPTTAEIVAQLKADAQASRTALDRAGEAIKEEHAKLRPVLQNAVPCPKLPEPEGEPLSRHAEASRVMSWIALHRSGQGPARIRRFALAAAEHLKMLVEEINTRHEFQQLAEDAASFEAGEIGRRLKELKALKPEGVKFDAFLKDRGVKLSATRANEYIRVHEGKTTVLKLQEDRRGRDQKSRDRRQTPVGVRPRADSKGEIDLSDPRKPSEMHHWEEEQRPEEAQGFRVAMMLRADEAARLAFYPFEDGPTNAKWMEEAAGYCAKVIDRWEALAKSFAGHHKPKKRRTK